MEMHPGGDQITECNVAGATHSRTPSSIIIHAQNPPLKSHTVGDTDYSSAMILVFRSAIS